MIRSPSMTKKRVSCLVIEDDGWTWRSHSDPPCEVMPDQVVIIPPGERLIDRLAPRLAVADDARRTKVKGCGSFMSGLDGSKNDHLTSLSRGRRGGSGQGTTLS